MRRPSVFVSSTCYDLRQVRTDVKEFIESLGLDPVLSEFNSFPINPDVGTLDNCLKAVEARADIFVLIVGARYGSILQEGKSITNLEFLSARAKGIPVYVFVTRPVLAIMPVWKANPSADFSGVADSPKLFEFVAELKESGETWVFPFDSAQEIFEVLRTQLAYLFMDALGLRLKANKSGGISAGLADLGGSSLRLVIERPRGWEYLLLCQVLEDEIEKLKNEKRDWQYGLAMGAGSLLKPLQVLQRIREKAPDAGRMMANLETIINKALPGALGPPGASGDAEAIVFVAKRIASVYRDTLQWKLDFQRLAVPEEMENLRTIAGALLDNVVAEIEEFSRTLKKSTTEGLRLALSGQVARVKLTLTPTIPDLTEYNRELQRIVGLFEAGKLKNE